MIKSIENLYKKKKIFKCVHDVHRHFQAEMSPFHILHEKECFPHGCITFKWTCKLLAKQKKCFRNFTVVGRECFNCRYFYEEKIHQNPQLISDDESSDVFIQEYEEFDEWVSALKEKRISCEGTIHRIIPDLYFRVNGSAKNLHLKGFLVTFDNGFIDNNLFDSRFYLHISCDQQNRLQLREGDEVEFEANLKIYKGRFEFVKAGRFQLMMRGRAKAMRRSDALLALNTYTIQPDQPNKCISCSYGIMIDIQGRFSGPSREVICTQGIADYGDCTVNVLNSINENSDGCANIEWNTISCHRPLQ